MKLRIEINDQTKKRTVIKKNFKKAAEVLLKELGEDVSVSILLCEKDVIKELNSSYRKKDKETDVLSFVYDNAGLPDDADMFYGEIIICPEVARAQAVEYSNDYNSELKRLLVHGVLHLIGYDHELGDEEERIMLKKQEELLLKLEGN